MTTKRSQVRPRPWQFFQPSHSWPQIHTGRDFMLELFDHNSPSVFLQLGLLQVGQHLTNQLPRLLGSLEANSIWSGQIKALGKRWYCCNFNGLTGFNSSYFALDFWWIRHWNISRELHSAEIAFLLLTHWPWNSRHYQEFLSWWRWDLLTAQPRTADRGLIMSTKPSSTG